MLNMASKPLVLIRKVFVHLIRSSFCLFSQLGLIVFLSSLSIHFSLSCTFLYNVTPSRWYLRPVTLYVFMSCPEKYIAESRFPVPNNDAAIDEAELRRGRRKRSGIFERARHGIDIARRKKHASRSPNSSWSGLGLHRNLRSTELISREFACVVSRPRAFYSLTLYFFDSGLTVTFSSSILGRLLWR